METRRGVTFAGTPLAGVAIAGLSDSAIAFSDVCAGSYLNSVPQTGQRNGVPTCGTPSSIRAAQLGQ